MDYRKHLKAAGATGQEFYFYQESGTTPNQVVFVAHCGISLEKIHHVQRNLDMERRIAAALLENKLTHEMREAIFYWTPEPLLISRDSKPHLLTARCHMRVDERLGDEWSDLLVRKGFAKERRA